LTVRDIEKYRRRNPARTLENLGDYRFFTVIPCYNENASFGQTVESLKKAALCAEEKVAVVAVINHPVGADERESLELLRRINENEFEWESLFAIYAPGLTGGVGEARKIGMDSCLQSCAPEHLCDTVICSMDGDTLVSADYFKEIAGFFNCHREGGVVCGLRHQSAGNDENEAAIRRYEAYLDRYVNQLKRCGSPYAFHTVGSAFAVRGEAYMKCGGMKVRKAGEDFYFLQELAKTSGVGVIEKVLVFPSSRISERTPFGTGQAVKDIISGKALSEVSDAAFDRLEKVLQRLSFETLDTDTPSLPESPFFETERFFKVWPGIRRNTQPQKLQAAFHIWFDGLKTLRFLHWCDSGK
jgi:hypothetical protein